MSTAASQPASNPPRLMIVMGVCGSGKSTVAQGLADAIGARYLDGDDYHSAQNVAKMSSGEALDDEDRWPWLACFARAMNAESAQVVGACSALRRDYRECINKVSPEPVLFIYLNGSKQLIARRMSARQDHFMPEGLLQSQFEVLEPPESDELAISVDISGSSQQVIDATLEQLRRLQQ